ncbi:MAG: type II toxin-antitoxin system HicB family antitoxin [Chlamydiales bacterium]|nr:type II toxin-antitoxin system HicB family antitoxin [Chlamydiales bacterium]
MMKYKSYIGRVEYDDEAKIFHGEVIGLRDVITFQGTSVEELEQSFKDSVDDYLAFCKERGEKPEKPFSGIFNLRIPPDLHARLVLQAKLMGISLNTYIAHALDQVTQNTGS